MNNAVARADGGKLMESVLIQGDLSRLTPQDRSAYYLKVCESVGLNPLTKPFEYIMLNGKLTLYALRGCTDQLRAIHGVSVEDMTQTISEGVCIVTVKVRDARGRTDMAKGVVTIANLKGDALANALMKAETKAKRRATLSICGLGFLDETEIETIPAEAKRPNPHVTRAEDIHGEIPPPEDSIPQSNPDIKKLRKVDQRPLYAELQKEMEATLSLVELGTWGKDNAHRVAQLDEEWQKSLRALFSEHRKQLIAADAELAEIEDASE